MIKLSRKDFLAEIEAEVAGYEEITKEMAQDFVKRVDAYIEKNKGINKKIYVKGSECEIHLKDESDLFNMVDQYLVAVVNEETDSFWKDWKF